MDDTRKARTIIALQAAAKFLITNKNDGVEFMNKNPTYFPNNTEKQVKKENNDKQDVKNIPEFAGLNAEKRN